MGGVGKIRFFCGENSIFLWGKFGLFGGIFEELIECYKSLVSDCSLPNNITYNIKIQNFVEVSE